MLYYQCYQHLTVDHAILCNRKFKYCPLRIAYQRHLRDTQSGVTIPLQHLQKRNRTKKGWPPTEEKVRRDFEACLTDWEKAEEMRRRLRSALEKVDDKLPPVKKIVAFACATITDEERPGPRFQHVLMLALKRILEAHQQQARLDTANLGAAVPPPATPPPLIPCFAQDPAYTDVDKTILAEHGVTVLDDPRGFLEVDDQSAVLSFAPNICVRQIVADIARPALLIWNTVLDEDESLSLWRERFGDSRKFETLHELEGSLYVLFFSPFPLAALESSLASRKRPAQLIFGIFRTQ